MRFAFRHGDSRFPFLWESSDQPPARWHSAGDGPVQYFADTPDGAWAEFLRHEEIREPSDLAGVSRRMWAVEIADEDVDAATEPALPSDVLLGGFDSYERCQAEAARCRAAGRTVIRAPSAALLPGAARGQSTHGGLKEAQDVDGVVWVVLGVRPEARGWAAADGAPAERVLGLVRHFSDITVLADRGQHGADRR